MQRFQKDNLGAGAIKFRTYKNATLGIGKDNLFAIGLSAMMFSNQLSDLSDMWVNSILQEKGYYGNIHYQQPRVRLGANINKSAVSY